MESTDDTGGSISNKEEQLLWEGGKEGGNLWGRGENVHLEVICEQQEDLGMGVVHSGE